MSLPTESDPVWVIPGDCTNVMRSLPAGSVDAVVTDPPYGLEFMGKEWDSFGGGRVGMPGIGDRGTPWVSSQGWNGLRCRKCGHLPHGGSPCQCPNPDIRAADDRWLLFQEFNRQWAVESLRVLKPGGYLLAFGGTRTYHRLTCAVEDAGFEVRDCLMWMYGTGFPKGNGCLKPAWEPILLARRPGPKVLPLGVDECRIAAEMRPLIAADRRKGLTGNALKGADGSLCGSRMAGVTTEGRYPANVVHDGSDEVMETFAAFGERRPGERPAKRTGLGYMGGANGTTGEREVLDSGTAARFFYCAKASKSDRGEGNTHPTVKPVALMRWLARLVCPPGGLVLDPFGGSGTTAVACILEGRRCYLIERELGYAEIALGRIAEAKKKQGNGIDK